MNSVPPIIAATTPEPAQPARGASCACGEGREPDPTDRYMRMLHRLADLGMELSERLVEQVRDEDAARRAAPAPAEPAPVPASTDTDFPKAAAEPELTPEARVAKHPATLAFDRLTRSVRLCMALSMKFHNDRLAREKQAAAGPVTAEQERKPRRRGQIERLVKEMIERERDPFDRARLRSSLYERLKEEDIEQDLLDRPLGELIARICRDLGVKPDWDFWSSDYWAEEEARLQPPGSPYAEPPDPEPEEPPAAPLRPGKKARVPEPPSG